MYGDYFLGNGNQSPEIIFRYVLFTGFRMILLSRFEIEGQGESSIACLFDAIRRATEEYSWYGIEEIKRIIRCEKEVELYKNDKDSNCDRNLNNY
ncbi:MAG: hypothetical protein LBU84_08435 [Prevotella sp.]|jgi:hypothetical protein|nr:hypothetical protein [Prevotella sp.]